MILRWCDRAVCPVSGSSRPSAGSSGRRALWFVEAVSMLALLLLSMVVPSGQAWVTNRIPKTDVSYVQSAISTEMKTFATLSKESNNFRLLLTEADSMLIGGRNIVYDINMATLQENKKIQWQPKENAVTACRDKMKTKDQCQNYIRVVARKTKDELFVCGTHAFAPICRTYKRHNDINTGNEYLDIESEENGMGMCPFDPDHNSTALYAGGRLYSGTVVDFTGQDELIYSRPIRTVQHNSVWLNEPDFVNSFEYQDMIYYFLRETAVEYINCGKSVFSRVARICKKDTGHQFLSDNWTSFFKARLNCSIPGEFPFYFNEIQSTSDIGKGNYRPSFNFMGTDMVYSVFTTPGNSISGSAICAFNFSDIMKSFEGKFKEQKSAKDSWQAVEDEGRQLTKCVNDSTSYDYYSINFIKKHPLMDTAVPTVGGRPLLVLSGTNTRYTQIAIDWQVLGVDRKRYDVMFIGTDDGRVLKAVNTGKNDGINTVIIEDILVFSDKSPIVNLKVYRNLLKGEEKLIVISKNEIKSIPLARCHLRKSCSSCVALQDPYCSWQTTTKKCVNSKIGLQSVSEGKHDQCPDSMTTEDSNDLVTPTTSPCPTCAPCVCTSRGTTVAPSGSTTTAQILRTMDSSRNDNKIPTIDSIPRSTSVHDDNKIPPVIGTPEGPRLDAATMQDGRIYSVLHMAIALICAIILSLLVGFFIGYRVSMCRRSRFHSDTPYMDSRAAEIRKNHHSKAEMSPYVNVNEAPFIEVQKQLNVVLNLPPKGTNNLPNGSAENKVQAKGKKVYL